MPKRAPQEEGIDPVRARLAAAAAAPVTPERQSVRPPEEGPSAVSQPVVRRRSTGQPMAGRKVRKPQVAPGKNGVLKNRKFMVTGQEAERMDEVIHEVSRAFGGKVAQSQITRAMWSILADLEEAISRRPRGEPRSLPSTGDSDAQAEYEQAVELFLSEVLRRGM